MKTMAFILTLSLSLGAYAQSLFPNLALYHDCIGRTTLFPAQHQSCLNQDYDTNNAVLWSGEMALLLYEINGYVPTEFKETLVKTIQSQFIKPGLLSRHPEPYRFKADMRPISFDEFHGVAFLAAVIPEFRKNMDDVVEHGMQNDWQYWDVPKYEKGKSWLSILSWQGIKELYHYLQEDSLRKSTIKYPELYPIFATHHFHQRAFYKMLSTKYKPSAIEELYFAASGILAAHKDNYSSLSMWIFRWKALEKINYQSQLLSWVRKYYHSQLNERFGQNYEQVVFANFYEDSAHPFHQLSVTAHQVKAASANRKPAKRYKKEPNLAKPYENIRSYFDK